MSNSSPPAVENALWICLPNGDKGEKVYGATRALAAQSAVALHMIDADPRTNPMTAFIRFEELTFQAFATPEKASEWMLAQVDDPFVDNDRFAFADDADANASYDECERNGCCGSFDADVVVDGKRARIGCNYGH